MPERSVVRGRARHLRPPCWKTPRCSPQHGRVVLVVLQDGRQLEGELHTLAGRYEVGGVVFDACEIEELEDVT
jgi:hypothetical protein